MSEEPTYAELVHENSVLKTKNADLSRYVRRLEATISRLAAELAMLRRKKPRKLDVNAASAFDRPYR
jgi:predicted RNase H-like nuclease (RuvC/YqgF family)